jgi:hypothetical protein
MELARGRRCKANFHEFFLFGSDLAVVMPACEGRTAGRGKKERKSTYPLDANTEQS